MTTPNDPGIDPLSIDFRTLRLLERVHSLRSFTRAADELGLTQSAVSYAIDKLRHVFGDPLFARQGRSIHPTARCDKIVEDTRHLIASYRQMAHPPAFDPATASGTFSIACNYYERALWLPGIVHALRARAPGITLNIVDAGGTGPQRLLDGEADLLIGPIDRDGPLLHSRPLYEETYACVMDPAHPAAREPLSLATYLHLDHVLVTYGGRWTSRYITVLAEMGHDLRVALRVPSPAGLESLVAGSDLVGTVPHRLSRVLGQSIHITACPVPTSITIHTAWTALNHRSAQHIWLRTLIHTLITQSA